MPNIVYFILFYIIYITAILCGPNEQVAIEILEDGKNQYKLLQERGELPHYGECWKAAIEHIHESCNYLSENVQSDIALRITNCFLEMSGHVTYNCDLDKKPNLRGICINSMTDRAFNVYTEFYTHAQNICWFLRGQLWQEKMSEIALKASKQLHVSLEKHEILLEKQNTSLYMQQRLLIHGQSLEMLLNESRTRTQAVMNDIQKSTLEHQRLLNGLVNGLTTLQSWLVGEISWLDTFLFYIGGVFIILAFTSVECTSSARLPLILVLSGNVLLEHGITNFMTSSFVSFETNILHENIQNCISWCRRFISVICLLILGVKVYYYQNYSILNNYLLLQLREQNQKISVELESIKKLVSRNIDYSNENSLHLTNEKANYSHESLSVSTTKIQENLENNQTPTRTNNTQQNYINGHLTPQSPSRYYLRARS